MRLLRRLWYLVSERRMERELREELAFHREMKRRELEDAGAAPSDATVAARRALGNELAARARARDVWIPPWLQDLLQDVWLAGRLLRKDWRLTVSAIVALSLGLGATSTAFTFVRGTVLGDLPLAGAERLVLIRTVDARGRQLGISYADARDWRAAARTLSHVAVSLELPINIAEGAVAAQRFYGSFVSFDIFEMVGQRPALGRTFRAEDDIAGAPRVAILAHTTWQSRYGGDPAVIGRAVRINDVSSTIIGVMPPGFHFPASAEVWVPIGQIASASTNIDATRGNRPPLVLGLGRLADGVDISQARAEMDAVTSRLARDYPNTNDGISASLEPLDSLLRGAMRGPVLMVMGAVSFVLLIACVNVANLLLARAVHRGREMGVRTALGATRWRIVRQLSVEALLLTIIAGILGLLLSVAGVRVFSTQLLQLFADGPSPYWLRFSIDWTVFAFLSAIALGSTVAFGLAPALHLTRFDNHILTAGARGVTGGGPWTRWRTPVMAAQIALTLVLLAGTGLLVRSFVAVTHAAGVVDPTNLITMQVALSAQKYTAPAQVKRFYEELDERLAAVPEFSAATLASDIPMRTVINATREITMEGQQNEPGATPGTVAYLFVGPRYFETLKLPLLRGRQFTRDDGTPGREGAIVNQRFVSAFFPGRDPIGQRIRLSNPTAPAVSQPWFTIIGVVPTVPQILVRESPEPVVYVSAAGEPAPHRFVSILVRASGDRAATVARLRAEVGQIDPDLPVYGIRTLSEIIAMSQWQYRVFGSIFALLAIIALVLATVGVSALVAHTVTARTQEIGVRAALGADTPRLVWLFVKSAMVQLAIGIAVGLAGAAMVGRLLAASYADPYAQTFLIGIGPTDPLGLAVVTTLLIAATAAASVWPALRTSRVSPVIALRQE